MAKAVIVKLFETAPNSEVVLMNTKELKKLCSVLKSDDGFYAGRYGTNKAELRKAANKK